MYTFFWNGPLSNWYPSPFNRAGIHYLCVEHYMMAHKALLFDDLVTYDKILKATDPKHMKALGRQVTGYSEARWDAFKYEIVLVGNLYKYTNHIRLRAYLMGTGDDIIVEASPHDRIWGIGFGVESALANRDKWGLNLLGNILTELKGMLQN